MPDRKRGWDRAIDLLIKSQYRAFPLARCADTDFGPTSGVAPSPPSQIATNVLIAWNCSTEQARAIALAMPILQKADRVTVLTVIGGTGVVGPSAEQLIRYLHCNGIVAESMRVELDGRSTGETILASAQSLGCDLLIKGAYTQSRLRQWIFGGATQHVLENAALPVLLAN